MLHMNIWTVAFFMAFFYIFYLEFNRPEISVKKALYHLKDNLVRMIVFFQEHYTDSDKVVLIKKWLDTVDFDRLPEEQKKLFKEYVSKK